VFDFDADLASTKRGARAREQRTSLDALYGSWDAKPTSLERALTLVEDVAKAELERETNLNTRATAVASVAGVIIALSGAVARTVFGAETWTDMTKLLAVALFVVAVFCLTLSIFFTVIKVLRPTRGPRTKNFLGETLVGIWNDGRAAELLRADPNRLLLLRFDRTMRTLPEWHVRNRLKARWLRRAWVFLAYGVLAIAIASVFVVGETLGIPPEQTDGITTKIEWRQIGGFVVALCVLTILALGFDWVGAKRADDPKKEKELELAPADEAIDKLVAVLNRPVGRSGMGV
jgi:hypothetical protein